MKAMKNTEGSSPQMRLLIQTLSVRGGNLSTLPYLLSPGRSVLRESDLPLNISNQTWCNSGFGRAVPQSLNEIIFFPALLGRNMYCPNST